MSIEDMAVLCVKNRIVKQIVENFFDKKVVEINVAQEKLDRERWEILNAFKAIAKTGCAELKIGRRGQQTRVRWTHDIKAVMASKPENIELVDSEPVLNDEIFANAPLEQLIDAIKVYHNVSAVHLVY